MNMADTDPPGYGGGGPYPPADLDQEGLELEEVAG